MADKNELERRLRFYEEKYGPYIQKRGLHNWKNLFRRPTILEWVVLIMLLLGLFMGWAYQQDIKNCREFLQDIELHACNICNTMIKNITQSIMMEETNKEIWGEKKK